MKLTNPLLLFLVVLTLALIILYYHRKKNLLKQMFYSIVLETFGLCYFFYMEEFIWCGVCLGCLILSTFGLCKILQIQLLEKDIDNFLIEEEKRIETSTLYNPDKRFIDELVKNRTPIRVFISINTKNDKFFELYGYYFDEYLITRSITLDVWIDRLRFGLSEEEAIKYYHSLVKDVIRLSHGYSNIQTYYYDLKGQPYHQFIKFYLEKFSKNGSQFLRKCLRCQTQNYYLIK